MGIGMGDVMATTAARAAFCPHCFLVIEAEVEHPWPPRLARCPHCKLTIGPGRARDTAEAAAGARSTAAGVFAHDAREASHDATPPSQDRIRDAIRSVAAKVGSQPERLLMVDYQQRAATDQSLPTLGDVFAVFGSWKRARRESALA